MKKRELSREEKIQKYRINTQERIIKPLIHSNYNSWGLDQFIEMLKNESQDLEAVSIDININSGYDYSDLEMSISGNRKLSDDEIDNLIKIHEEYEEKKKESKKRKNKEKLDSERKLYERLHKKFGQKPKPSESPQSGTMTKGG